MTGASSSFFALEMPFVPSSFFAPSSDPLLLVAFLLLVVRPGASLLPGRSLRLEHFENQPLRGCHITSIQDVSLAAPGLYQPL